MSTPRPLVADRRASTRVLATLVAAVLALTLTALTRSSPGEHHAAHAKAVVSVSAGGNQHALGRLDQHAVADRTAATRRTSGVDVAAADAVAHLDSRSADATRVRGPPGSAV